MTRLLTLCCVLLLGLGSCSLPKEASERPNEVANPLLGSWKFKQIHYVYLEKDTVISIEEAQPGRLLVTPQRYAIMYNPGFKARQAFENLSKPSEAEVLSAFRSIVFNSGSYTLADSVFATKADIAKVPGFEQGLQYYRVSSKPNGIVEFTMFDETYPNGDKPEWHGKLEVRFILEKEKALAKP